MDKTAIVLAGGSSSRFGQDKGLLKIGGKTLIEYTVDTVSALVDETIVVTSSKERVAKYASLVGSDVLFAVDVCESNSPLIGALTGLGIAHGLYSLILPFDMPFISKEVISLLFELCVGKAAVIPRWPDGNIEPLHAVYCTKLALEAAKIAIAEGKLNMRAMIEKLRGVRYVSTLVVQQLDPELRTFFNINTLTDFKKATAIVALKNPKLGL
ncbi:MAG: molybdenum cofactor guanylyltransferase [Candidatus Bathyarchaeia archaeon]